MFQKLNITQRMKISHCSSFTLKCCILVVLVWIKCVSIVNFTFLYFISMATGEVARLAHVSACLRFFQAGLAVLTGSSFCHSFLGLSTRSSPLIPKSDVL